ncbi:enoyl-CoA hydratase/isomerase family protein [Amycolatopsis sp. NBC_01488]|uniref:(3,5-dihydroxyphenyl)acetyl-CoA 1,2-dioxygenase DpgC n=1 Tax=Amycolatopsis sp. NBC_01488 TaxID=2903563 RepID=UPI002E2E709E|nr:(3,5-dihydroxyphenyl)acetyl-CoA 1,2-dioxygenase DpgC [Amycolatopsis sp. NBC_01488]
MRSTAAGMTARPDPAVDAAALAEYVRQGAGVDEVRRAREDFLAVHAEAVYERLTAGFRRWLRIGELVSAAARVFPGLVPTEDELAAEEAVPPGSRRGLEIDQAIFFRAVLSAPRAGRHLIESMARPTVRAGKLLPGYRETGAVDLESVTVRRRGPAAEVTLRRPDHLNAEDNGLVADLETAVDLVLLDPASRVGVLRGCVMTHPRYAGRRVFSAGIDLKHLAAGRISYPDFLLGREFGCLRKLMHGNGAAKPWIAAVEGFAIGGGMQLLLVCDHVLLASDAYLSLPAAQEGIVPGVANLRLSRFTGPRLARQIILGGRRIEARDPEARLLCDEVVDPARMDEAIDAAVTRLVGPAVLANRQMLALAEEPVEEFRGYLAEFAYQQALRMNAPDVLGKVTGFAKKSKRG